MAKISPETLETRKRILKTLEMSSSGLTTPELFEVCNVAMKRLRITIQGLVRARVLTSRRRIEDTNTRYFLADRDIPDEASKEAPKKMPPKSIPPQLENTKPQPGLGFFITKMQEELDQLQEDAYTRLDKILEYVEDVKANLETMQDLL